MKNFNFKEKILFWKDPELGDQERKNLIILRGIGGGGYLFLVLEIWLPWLLITIEGFAGETARTYVSYNNLLKEVGNMHGILLLHTFFFIILSALFYVLNFMKISVLCIVISWLPKLLLILMLITDSPEYHFFPFYGMIIGIIGFCVIIYTGFKAKQYCC